MLIKRIHVFFVVLVFSGFTAVRTSALEYYCPFDTGLLEGTTDVIELRSSVHRVVPDLRTLLGKGNGENPWTDLDTVAGTTRTAANRTVVTFPDSLPPSAQALLTGPAGCTLKSAEDPRIPAREPRVVNLTVVYDRDDPTQPVVNPRRDGRQTFYHFLADRVFRYVRVLFEHTNVLPAVAYALGAFPDPGTIIDAMAPRVEDPAAGGWLEFNTNENPFALDGTDSACAVAPCSMYFGGVGIPLMAQDGDAFVTLNVANGQLVIGCRGLEPGAATNDGYSMRLISSLNVLRLHRITNDSLATQIGSDAAQTEGDGDKLGIRCDGDTISGYYVDTSVAATWNQVASGTDSTYSTAGFPWLVHENTTGGFNNFGYTQVVASRLSLGFQLLR